jgi:signal transduction histidine kinase
VDEQARGYVSKIATSAHRLSTLVKDLLSVSRIEAGRLQVTPQAVAIETLLQDTVDQLRFLARTRGSSSRW